MYARLTTFEHATAIDETARQIIERGRPEGIPATELYLMADRESGKVVTLVLFETEEDMRKGHETLSAMNAPGGGFGERTSVDLLEVVGRLSA
jgi:predicted N-acetyltransferase YhbS